MKAAPIIVAALILCTAIQSRAGAYHKGGYGQFCSDPSTRITNRYTCQEAAAALGLDWAKSWWGPWDFPGCLHTKDSRNKVYFNLSPYAGIDPSKRPNYAEICTGEGSTTMEPTTADPGYPATNPSEGICGPCSSSDDCSFPCPTCVRGQCLPVPLEASNPEIICGTCSLPDDCFFPCPFCVSGVCQPLPSNTEIATTDEFCGPCSSNNDCSFPCPTCVFGQCLPIPIKEKNNSDSICGPCLSNEDCSHPCSTCVFRQCLPILLNETKQPNTTETICGPCSSNSDCSFPCSLCVFGQCLPIPLKDLNATGSLCGPCSSNDNCSFPCPTCLFGQCLPTPVKKLPTEICGHCSSSGDCSFPCSSCLSGQCLHSTALVVGKHCSIDCPKNWICGFGRGPECPTPFLPGACLPKCGKDCDCPNQCPECHPIGGHQRCISRTVVCHGECATDFECPSQCPKCAFGTCTSSSGEMLLLSLNTVNRADQNDVDRLINNGKTLTEIIKNLKDVVHKPLANYVKSMNDDINKINTQVETLTEKQKTSIHEASLLLDKTAEDVYLLRLLLTSFAIETIDRTNLIILIFQNLDVNQPHEKLVRSITLATKKMIDLFKKSHGLLTESMNMYMNINYNITDVQSHLKSFKSSIKDMGNEADDRMQKWIKKIRLQAYGGSLACLIAPPTCLIAYPFAAGFVETKINEHKEAVQRLKNEVHHATETVSNTVSELKQTHASVHIEMGIIVDWRREVDTLSSDFTSVDDVADLLESVGKGRSFKMLCALEHTTMEYIVQEQLDETKTTSGKIPLLNEECMKKTRTPPTIPSRRINNDIQCYAIEEYKTLQIFCQQGSKINISSAAFDPPCGHPSSSKRIVKKLCQGKVKCNLQAAPTVFGPIHCNGKRVLFICHTCVK